MGNSDCYIEMPQKKISVVAQTARSRKTSEASSSRSSLTKGAPSTGRRSSVTFQDGRRGSVHIPLDGDTHSHHRSVGHLLMLPVELGRRRRSHSWQGAPISKPAGCPVT